MPPQENSLARCICGDPNCEVPRGFCHCRCGKLTNIPKKSNASCGYVRGVPTKYMWGHQGRIRPTIEEAVPFKIDGVYCRLIALTQGFYAIVWESDYKRLMQWKWFAHRSSHGKRKWYAYRNEITSDGTQFLMSMHRDVIGLTYGDELNVDHIDSDATLDNRRSNLRIATTAENGMNRYEPSNNTSGQKGVTWVKRICKWQAQIWANGQHYYLGVFDLFSDAQQAYLDAVKRLHREFAPQERKAWEIA